MTLDDARKIAQAVPSIKFSITTLSDGMGMAMMADIVTVENIAKRLPVTDEYVDYAHLCIGAAYSE